MTRTDVFELVRGRLAELIECNPGDIKLERKGYTFYFPLTTGIVVSIVIALILWIFRR